jgi:hypothetical protein
VAGETLHETGITVPAAMTATHIRIDTVIEAGDGGLGQNGLCEDLFDFHCSYYNGETKKLKVLPTGMTVPSSRH